MPIRKRKRGCTATARTCFARSASSSVNCSETSQIVSLNASRVNLTSFSACNPLTISPPWCGKMWVCYVEVGFAMGQLDNPTRPKGSAGHSTSAAYLPAVSVCNLRKKYGSTEAVSNVSFDVDAGQIFGLIGPNAAGKTTTLECILGLRRPDGGSIRINGLDLRTHAAQLKMLLGAQLQAATLQDKITPREALDLFGSFYPQPFSGDELLSRLDLMDKADAAFATLSGGQRQRLFLALALVNRPAVLVLDEPAAGLDPQARRTLRALIREIQTEGRTVLLSTHDLEEAGQLCDRIAILDGGRIIAAATPAELVARASALARVIVRTAPSLPGTLVDSFADVARAVKSDNTWCLETGAPNRLLAEVVRRAAEARAELLELELQRPTLEDVYIELTGRRWHGGPEGGVS
jgi:ABC-2 type transport system ATP-binding protein